VRYLSVCSGIEAATVAWHPLGWTAAAYSEIEKFPSQVLAHHYPDVPNVGDMTKFKEWNLGPIDLLVGGTPCQSFSVAGLRKGLDDPRGNLMLTFLAIADQYRPRWLVWENVPGVLSSNGGKDFGTFLGALGELGYGFAYRILDAQYFGVAQRRRRVFVVGYLGDWRAAAAVLFERHSLSGDSAPSREKRKEVASGSGDGAQVGNLIGLQDCKHFDSEISGTIVTREGCVSDTSHMLMQSQPIATHGIGEGGELARCLNACDTASGRMDVSVDTFVSQPIALQDITSREKAQNGKGWNADGSAYTVDTHATQGVAQPISFSGQMSNPHTDVDMTQTLQAKNPMAVAVGAFKPGQSAQAHSIGYENEMAPTLEAGSGGNNKPAVHYSTAVVSPTLTAANNPSRSPQSSEVTQQVYSVYQSSMAVRRLTPVECERLQGFGDNYTNIKDKCPDGPRYKALGNSMAVPVMAWIGKRIQEVEQMQCKPNR
jgi:DNA (cytosine-5)-methyltransferase 1